MSQCATLPVLAVSRYTFGMGRVGHRALLVALALAVVAPTALSAATPALGSAAPEFELPGAAGGEHSLAATLEQGPVVLVFYRAFW